MKTKLATLYSSETSLKEDIQNTLRTHENNNLLTINQVVMMLPSRKGAHAIITTMVFEDKTP